MDDIRFNFYDSPTRTLTEEQFLRPGSTTETWEDAVFRGNRKSTIDSLEKLARSFGSPVNHVKPTAQEKSILLAAADPSSLDQRGDISRERRTENVSALEFVKIFRAPEPGSSSSLNKSANPRVARVEKDVLDTGEISVSEYDESGKLIRGWISKDGSLPPMMSKTIIPDGIHGVHGPAPERSLLSSIFERRAIA